VLAFPSGTATGFARLFRSPLTAHRSPLTAHRSPLTAHRMHLVDIGANLTHESFRHDFADVRARA
jgi:hypothetical protein